MPFILSSNLILKLVYYVLSKTNNKQREGTSRNLFEIFNIYVYVHQCQNWRNLFKCSNSAEFLPVPPGPAPHLMAALLQRQRATLVCAVRRGETSGNKVDMLVLVSCRYLRDISISAWAPVLSADQVWCVPVVVVRLWQSRCLVIILFPDWKIV